MSFATLLRQASQQLLDLVFPPRCVVCQRTGTWLCSTCLARLPRLPIQVCVRCGKPEASGLCASCRQAPLAIDGIRSVLRFEDSARHTIHCFKYANRPVLATPLAGLMAEYWREQPLPADVIVPVPLHVARQRERGYNQADLLARALGHSINLPVSGNALRRVRPTPAQVGLNMAERRANVCGAFASPGISYAQGSSVTWGNPDVPVYGQRVLVVDDVCTTGATLEACSLALRAAGAVSVWGFTLARA